MKPAVLVPMAKVMSVARSIEFYKKLGFVAGNTVTEDDGHDPVWAWLESDGAQLMLAQADDAVVASQQAVLFYLYCEDVAAMRDQLTGTGVAAGEIEFPEYAPRGEFRIEDPDGYVLMVTHT
jgi:predicted enzyme related to lactoylglutathione lyase